MKQLILIVIVLFMTVILYLISLPPKELTLKDIQPEVYRRSIPDEPEVTVTAAADSIKEVLSSSVSTKPETEKIATADTTKEVLRPSVPIKPETQEISTVVSTKKDTDTQSNIEYYIIIGGFSSLSLAQQKATKLRSDLGANIVVLPPTAEGLYRISYGKYSKLEEAKASIQSIRTKIKSDAWIFSLRK